MKFVDADALVEHFRPDTDYSCYTAIWMDSLKEWIKSQPDMELAPVVHAHWIERQLSEYGEYEFCCSNCEHTYDGYDDPGNYCPDCGAIMDEKEG